MKESRNVLFIEVYNKLSWHSAIYSLLIIITRPLLMTLASESIRSKHPLSVNDNVNYDSNNHGIDGECGEGDYQRFGDNTGNGIDGAEIEGSGFRGRGSFRCDWIVVQFL